MLYYNHNDNRYNDIVSRSQNAFPQVLLDLDATGRKAGSGELPI